MLNAVPTSGQARVNAKRNARGNYWRSVKVLVPVDMEPFFRKTLRRLGPGARIQGCRKLRTYFGYQFDLHVPGIPARAVQAEPSYYSDWNGQYHVPRLDYLVFYDANGQRILCPDCGGSRDCSECEGHGHLDGERCTNCESLGICPTCRDPNT